jgi:hypothetical protein
MVTSHLNMVKQPIAEPIEAEHSKTCHAKQVVFSEGEAL